MHALTAAAASLHLLSSSIAAQETQPIALPDFPTSIRLEHAFSCPDGAAKVSSASDMTKDKWNLVYGDTKHLCGPTAWESKDGQDIVLTSTAWLAGYTIYVPGLLYYSDGHAYACSEKAVILKSGAPQSQSQMCPQT